MTNLNSVDSIRSTNKPPYSCGKLIAVPNTSNLFLDEYAQGYFYVLHNGRRIGVIIKVGYNFHAEINNQFIRSFKSKFKAAIYLMSNNT
jgi:hypothetical protein